MSALVFSMGIAAVFMAGGLTTTILIDLVAHQVDRTTYWRAFWLVANTVSAVWSLSR